MPVDTTAPRHQLLMELRPRVKPHNKCNARLIQLSVRQHLCLAVGNRLINACGALGAFVGSWIVGYLIGLTGNPGAAYIFMTAFEPGKASVEFSFKRGTKELVCTLDRKSVV